MGVGQEPPAKAQLPQTGARRCRCLAWAREASTVAAVPLLWAASRGRLRKEGLPELPPRLRAESVSERIEKRWREACAAGKPSLFRVLVRVCGWDLFFGTIGSCMMGLMSSLTRPLILKRLVESLTDENASGSAELWIALLGLALFVEGLSAADRTYFGADMVGLQGVSAIASLAQQHSAKMPACLQDTGPPVVNLVGTDAVRLMENQKGLILLPLGITAIIGGVTALLLMLGPMGLVGLVPMFLMLGLNSWFSYLAQAAEHKNLALVDERMHIMGQVVHGVKAVKLTAWEEKYAKLLADARARECVPLKKWRIFLQYTRQVGRLNPIVASCALFTTQALLRPEAMARPADVFAAANIFLSLRLPFIALPEAMTYWATLHVTLRRFESFLTLPTAEERPSPQVAASVPAKLDARGEAVVVEGASFSWPDGERAKIPMLEGLRLTARPGEMVAVVGDVGSGKTTLLAGLLGDLRLDGGRCEVCRPLGWVPQKPFVLSGTLERNVAMGRRGDVAAVVRAAALEADVERLGGLKAEVGERGVTLSGGQAQRLSLARALLGEPPLLLADDPLSAVDARSSAAIFAALEAYARGGGCVVMALNQLHLLRRFNRIVILVPPNPPVVVEVANGAVQAEALDAVKGPLGDAIRQSFAGAHRAVDGTEEELAGEHAEADEECDEAVEPANRSSEAPTAQLLAKDTQSTGTIKWAVISRYIRGMGTGYASLCAVLSVATYAAMGFVDRWLAIWVAEAEDSQAAGELLNHTKNVLIYCGGCVVFALLLFWTSYAFAEGGVRSSRNLHHLCLDCLLHAPLNWFESMPSGRILSRFSSDVALVDQAVAQWADNLTQLSCTLVLLVVQTLLVVPLCAIPFLVAFVIFGAFTRACMRAAQDMKRWGIDSMSPVLTTLSETFSGRQSLRAMDLTPLMAGFLHEYLDCYARFNRSAQLPVDFGMLFASFVSILVGCSTGVFCLLRRDILGAPLMALALTYSFLVPYFLAFYGDILNRFLVSLTGLERLLHYAELEQEPPWHLPGEEALAGAAWPCAGALAFEDVSLTYRAGLAPALSNVSFAVPGGSSVGVVGRSGAGKSSLLGLLFRLREPTAGRVLVDGVDIARLGLQVLRRRLAILPQEPLLFPGSCRENLDPFGEHADERLRTTLSAVGLPDLLEDNGRVGTSRGSLSALSVGERQLLALARLMLRPEADSRVVLFDEPTSSVDAATDQRVQEALHGRFGKSTVLTVAHRLQTVLGADRILVLDAGRVAELGPPAELLADSASHLASLAKEAGLKTDVLATHKVAPPSAVVDKDEKSRRLCSL